MQKDKALFFSCTAHIHRRHCSLSIHSSQNHPCHQHHLNQHRLFEQQHCYSMCSGHGFCCCILVSNNDKSVNNNNIRADPFLLNKTLSLSFKSPLSLNIQYIYIYFISKHKIEVQVYNNNKKGVSTNFY